MNDYENNTKVGHPGLGIFLGLLGIVIALLLSFVTGAVATGVAVLLGLIAILMGVKARRGGKGIGAIITGGIAIALAVLMLVTTIGTFTAMREKAASSGVAPLFAKYVDKPYLGLVGIIISLPQDEATLQELIDEMNQLNELQTDVPAVQ